MDNLETASISEENEHKKASNGHSEGGGQVNGVSNGYSGDNGSSSKHHKSSSHKDKHRDRDRDRDHKKDHKSSRDKDRDRDKERDKHSSSKDKDKSKDHKSSSRDKERDRDKDKHSSSDKHRSKDKDRHHDDKDKKSSSKDHKSSSHSSSRDKEHKSSSSGHDKHKHSSSSSKDKDKDRHSSSKDKDRKSSSSSSKHHSSSKDKDRHRDRSDKDSKRDKDRNRDKSSKHENGDKKRDKVDIKEEKFSEPQAPLVDLDDFNEQPIMDVDPLDIKNEPEYNSQNMSAASSCDYSFSQFNKSEPNFKEFNQTDTSQMNGGGDDDRGNDFDDEDVGGDADYNTEEDSQDLQIKEEPEQDEEGSDDDLPLASRASTPTKRKVEDDDDDDDVPLMARKKVKKEKKAKKRSAIDSDFDGGGDYDDDYGDEKPKKKKQKIKKEVKHEIKRESTDAGNSPKKRKKKDEQEPEVWKWWEEEKKDDGTKWKFLEHKGPVFAPPYERLPESVKFYYDGKEMRLSEDAEEVAGFYARMLDHDYTSKEVFNNNFFKDWRKTMTDKERSKITDLKKCNFKPMQAYFLDLSEKNRNRTKEEKEKLKQQNADLLEEYGYCLIDGHREKIGNFKIEPPGLFRGRGEHPKMGMLKRRVMPEDVSINCSKDSKFPQAPPGHKWKDVRHDPTVTWLASWTENVQNQVKYVMLNPSSKLKGEKDWQKYETARRLAKSIDKIRKEYREDWKSKEMRIRQRAVALYFIDKLALRAGNEKDEDQADTVGCCSLRVEHISLHEQRDGKEYVVVFDFLGKDSIRYYNEVPVEKRVFKNLQLFMENKSPSDDLFDRLNTAVMNKHLNELMEGLTAKVFRTYNASWTLQQQLDELTNPDDTIPEKILSYNRANRAVAILCNHQRSVPKGHAKSMEKLKEKIEQKKEQIYEGEQQVKDAKRAAKGGSVKEQVNYDKKKKLLERLKDQLKKLELQETDRDENKSIALGTSKLNYLDPRISVAWCKKHNVPIEKIYNKTQRDKFRWAIDMATEDYVF